MSGKFYLIVSHNTGQMLLVDKVLRDNKIETEIVPLPPQPGLICTRAVKIADSDLDIAQAILDNKKIIPSKIIEAGNLILQELFEATV